MTASTPRNPAENLAESLAENIYDVAVIGAGIIGLSAALALSDAGLRVLALDRQQAMRQASWAAAGMLAANDPHNPAELHALSLYSESLYPDFLARIHALTGRAISIRTTQTLQGLPAGDRQPGQPLTAEQIQHLAPGLHPGTLIFSLMDERSLNPRDLAEALPAAVRAAGVDLREHMHLRRVEPGRSSHRLLATHEAQEHAEEVTFAARHVLFATGAWTGPAVKASSVHAPESPFPTIAPCKGQLVALQLDESGHTGCTLRIPGLYIVPRGAGLYIAGATLENVGFDSSTSESHSADLIRRAAQLWPPLARATRVDHWTGFRPMTPDELPVIGPLSSDEKKPTLWVATGHYRNGILLAPGTAHILRDLILGHTPGVALDAFRADRFIAGAGRDN